MEPVGEDLSYIYCGLNKAELGRVSIPNTVQPKHTHRTRLVLEYCTRMCTLATASATT